MPIAEFTFDPPAPVAGRPARFDGSLSRGGQSECCGGAIVSYRWEFGDGGEANGVAPEHTYLASGDYSVTLTVENDFGEQATATATLHVAPAPPPYPGGGVGSPRADLPPPPAVAQVLLDASVVETRGGRDAVTVSVSFQPPPGVPAENACRGEVTLSARFGKRRTSRAVGLRVSDGRCVALVGRVLPVRPAVSRFRLVLSFAGNEGVAAWRVSRLMRAG